MNAYGKMMFIVLFIAGALMFGYMFTFVIDQQNESHQNGHISLQDGDVLVVTEGQGEVRMFSEQGEVSCLVPIDSDTPFLCTSEFIGRYWTAAGTISEGEYVLRGEITHLYLPGAFFPADPENVIRQRIALMIVEFVWAAVMAYFYFRVFRD